MNTLNNVDNVSPRYITTYDLYRPLENREEHEFKLTLARKLRAKGYEMQELIDILGLSESELALL
ncbi:MAG: hypothetical protein V4525_13595 [Pseudomonadota bacterium]